MRLFKCHSYQEAYVRGSRVNSFEVKDLPSHKLGVAVEVGIQYMMVHGANAAAMAQNVVSFRQTCAGHEIARTGGITGSAGHVREARQERRRSGSHAPINRCGG